MSSEQPLFDKIPEFEEPPVFKTTLEQLLEMDPSIDKASWEKESAYFSPPDDEAPEAILYPKEEQAALFDFALLPAALCASSYSNTRWAFHLGEDKAPALAWADEANFKADPDGLSRSLFIASVCKPLDAMEDLWPYQPINAKPFELHDGIINPSPLSSAICCTQEDAKGDKTLHFCIRGTDLATSTNPYLSGFRTLVGYFLGTYLNIEKHAKNFTDLSQALRDYAADPENRIKTIVVSGHSLGAAAAQELSQTLAESGVETHLVGFGSPGSGAGLRAFLRAPITLSRHLAALPLKCSNALLKTTAELTQKALPDSVANQTSNALMQFAQLVQHTANFIAPKPAAQPKPIKATQFRHPNDPIPKIGSVLYRTQGQVIEALPPHDTTELMDGRSIKTQGISAHDAARYFKSLELMTLRALYDSNPFADNPPHLNAHLQARRDALAIETSASPQERAGAITAAREKAVAYLKSQSPDHPDIERITMQVAPQIQVDKIAKRDALRNLQTHLFLNSTP